MTVYIVIDKPINPYNLVIELGKAGFKEFVLNKEYLEVWNTNDFSAVKTVYDAHTGLPYPSELRLIEAKSIAKAIPNWAVWTISDLQTWFDANISSTQINAELSLADAKIVQVKQSSAILSLGKLIIALRDQIWPDLPDR